MSYAVFIAFWPHCNSDQADIVGFHNSLKMNLFGADSQFYFYLKVKSVMFANNTKKSHILSQLFCNILSKRELELSSIPGFRKTDSRTGEKTTFKLS
jgi:hypothetical protein